MIAKFVASSAAMLIVLGLWRSPQLQAIRSGARDGQQTKEFHVVARRYAFSPSRLEVNQGAFAWPASRRSRFGASRVSEGWRGVRDDFRNS